MIGFGFTAYMFIQSFPDVVRPNAARNVGLILVTLGTLPVMLGSSEYWHTSREMWKSHQQAIRTFPLLIVGPIALLGVFLFVDLILRIG